MLRDSTQNSQGFTRLSGDREALGEHHVKMKAETGGTLLQTKESFGAPEAERGKKASFCKDFRERATWLTP